MMPGAYNGGVARLVAQREFPGIYISGAALTASYGVPDIGLLTLDHFAQKIKEVSQSSGLPIIADADTGFGEEEMTYRTVYEYFNSGACGKLTRNAYRGSSVSKAMWSLGRKATGV